MLAGIPVTRATLFLEGPGGAAVTLIGDFLAHGYPAAQVDRLDLSGERGAIHLHGPELRLEGPVPEIVELDLAANYKASYHAAIEHFVNRLVDGGPFETGPEDNLETLAIVEAAYEAGVHDAGPPFSSGGSG